MAASLYLTESASWSLSRLKVIVLSTVAGALISLVVMGVFWLQDAQAFPVKHLQFEGAFEQVSVDELRMKIMPQVQGSFFHLDLAMLLKIVEAMPWVLQAEVERVWPDTVRIAVHEQQVLGRWNSSGMELLNVQGQTFVIEKEFLGELPTIIGPSETQKKLSSQYKQFLPLLGDLNLELVTLTMDERRSWRMSLNNGIELILGRDFVVDRLKRFLKVYPQMLGENLPQILSVDLRYTNGFSVKLKGQVHS